MKFGSVLTLMSLLTLASAGLAEEPPSATPRVAIDTNKGTMVVELDREKAPKTVESFLDNVTSGFYEGTLFHRVIPGFMIQGGGLTEEMKLKATPKALLNEGDNGLKNVRGSIAMARRNDPHSASVQFFVNLVDNEFLDHTGKNPQGWGYAVFGKVVEGMEVADTIATIPTKKPGDVPTEPVVIKKARIVP